MHEFGVGILGTGMYLPEKLLTNSDLEKMVNTTDEWIVKRTGMKVRHLLEEGVPTYTMGVEAAKLAIRDAGLSPADIDLIIATTVTPDYLTPSVSCLIQKHIQAENAAAFDLNAACTGFVYAMTTARQFIQTGFYRNVLIVSNEGLSHVTDWENRNTCILFGDAAGAVVLGRVDQQYGIRENYIASFGNLGHSLTLPCFYLPEEERQKRTLGRERSIWQDGSEVFSFAVRAMTDATRRVVEAAGKTIDDVDLVFPHQANLRIISGAAKRLHLNEEKVAVILQETGNISSASIPVALDMYSKNDRIKKGDTLVMVAFGGGLTVGSCLMLWGK
ncbi:MAG: ketoacyl-ACP synthase III [Ruminiclostridium sp.]|nr:ketoacyl-ACP synthase III [Ruminiclostridium sp.]